MGGYHLVNFFIHLLCAFLLFAIIRRALRSPVVGRNFRDHAYFLALATTLLWVVHPLTTGAVTYITQRAESLSAFFLLLTLWCAIRCADAVSRTGALGWGIGAVLACISGMATKETMVVAPLLIFFYDAFFLSSGFKDTLRRRLPLHGALAATWIILVILVAGAGGRGGTAGFEGGIAPLQYALTQIWAVTRYLRLSIWPSTLTFDYGTALAPLEAVLTSVLVLAGLLIAAAVAARNHRGLLFIFAAFCLLLAPSSSFVPVMTQTVAEHRMYLPLAIVMLLIVLGVHALGQRWTGGSWRYLRAVLLVFVAIALCWSTVTRNRVYQSEVTLWEDTVAKRPENARALTHLGSAMIKKGLRASPEKTLRRAQEVYTRAIAVDSTFGLAYANRGLVYSKLGMNEEALRDYDKAVALDIGRAELYNNRGILLGNLGRTEEAVADFGNALKFDPAFAHAHGNLGSAEVNYVKSALARNDTAAAQEAFSRALSHFADAARYDSSIVSTYRSRAAVYGLMGRYREAAEDCSRLIRRHPDDAVAYGDRAICWYQLGRHNEAWQDMQTCRRLGGLPNPELIRLLNRLQGVQAAAER